MKYLLTMTMMMFLTLCALNELQWRLIDMPSLKNLFFMHMQIFFIWTSRVSYFSFFFLLISWFQFSSFLSLQPLRYVNLCTITSKSIYAAAVSTISNIWLTEWLTDWLNIFCGCLNIPQMNRRLQFFALVFLHTKRKNEMCVEVDIRKRSEKNDMRKVYVIPSKQHTHMIWAFRFQRESFLFLLYSTFAVCWNVIFWGYMSAFIVHLICSIFRWNYYYLCSIKINV